ncbi:MAG TPA: cyclopropane-fatty-acyl-phospholipid synthase family protein [Dehalococcoidia bacterium]|nr:cyclopropane-fatty-acyl-phospholipid synthase family protein [Dehalococcoidia bacterium]
MSQALPVSVFAGPTVSLIDRLFPPPRNFALLLPDGAELPAAGTPLFTLALKSPGALRRMFTPPFELSVGEAYIHGHFEIDGDIFSAFSLIDASVTRRFSIGDLLALVRNVRALPKPGKSQPTGRRPARLRGALHSRQRDRAAVQYHYDLGDDFYRLWLDQRMQYSCAYFPTGGEDLDTAQERKLDLVCRKLRLLPGEQLLDIGCGWGGLATYAAETYGAHVLGVTLSANQAASAQEHLPDHVRVELLDYRDLADESFDKIVSVGMFEHVGRSQAHPYFAQVYRLMKPGGLFLNHSISSQPLVPKPSVGSAAPATSPTVWSRFIKRRIIGDGLFVQRYIFPDGQLIPVSEANLAAQNAGFEVRDVENLREHYALTLRQWFNRLEANRDRAISLTDEATYRAWRLYLASAAYGFEAARINVNQTLLAKPVDGRAGLPLTRADLYR